MNLLAKYYRLRFFYAPFLIFAFLFFSCNKSSDSSSSSGDRNGTVATRWADMTLYAFRHAFYVSPTYHSRSLGYLGLAMYECVVNSDASMRSMEGQLPGLELPMPETGMQYSWALALNAGQDTLLKLLYPYNSNMDLITFRRIDSLSRAINLEEGKNFPKATVERSVAFGRRVALAIYKWSENDGGSYGYRRHFDPMFTFPKGESYWSPPPVGQMASAYPLHPTWGNNRMFVTANSTMPVPVISAYSKDNSSEYYKLYKAVYDKNLTLTHAEKEIAAWWADDPTETFSPPGHSYNLATIAIKKGRVSLVKSAEAYARVGMAVADAFMCCWKAKFTYFNERPSTYIRSNIHSAWFPYWPEPPFPAFPSGHATQSAAAATVLADLFGENFSFTDNSHEGAKRFSDDLKFRSRTYSSFWQSAEESAYSRFLGGIHTQQDNQTGLTEGKKIGRNVNQLSWKK